MPLPTNSSPTQLVIQYGSGNTNVTVNLVALAINVSAVSAASLATEVARNAALKGYWNGLTYIPPGQITLITAS